uniref:Uncharacterized protein n=1 Tax=Tanacetum cinerariifolium TaxID=118510 RepID=A0A6L2MMP6_TANCI|nr:hypothetical protein [Tanacetum cinerariifolium]
MYAIRAQQKALDDELGARANRLKIGKSNLRLSSNLKSKEPTLQVEDLVFQVENNHSKKNNDIEKTPKPKTTKKKADSKSSPKPKPTQVTKEKRIKTSAKGDKTAKKKQLAKTSKAEGLTVLSDSSEDEDDDEVGVNKEDDENNNDDDDNDNDDANDDDDDDANNQDDDDDEQNDSDNDGDDFVHPKFKHLLNLKAQMMKTMMKIVMTPAPSPANVPSSSLQELPNFGSLFGFDHRLKTLETNFSKFMQTNQIAEAISSILGIFDKYLDHRMNEAVKVAVWLHSDRLRDEVQAKNEDFLNKLDENIQKIIKEQVKEQVKVRVSKILPKIEKTVNEQLKAEVLTRSSNSSKTSHDVAADLSKLELKKILIDKMESNKSIHRSDEKKNLYKALVDAYECDKLILDTFRDTVTLKRRRDDEDKDEETSTGSNRGSKRRRAGKEPESTRAPKEKTSKTSDKSTEGSKSHHKTASESAPVEEPMHTTQDLEEPTPQEFETGTTDDQPVKEASQHPHWFQKQAKPPTPDRAWSKTLPATHGRIQVWISNLAKKADSRTSFNELMDTPVDFSAFMMNQLKVDTLTPELLVGLTYELMKGSCKSLVDFEFFLEEVYKAITDQLDWNNPEGQQYPHDMLKVKYRLALTNMLFGESRIRGANVNSSMAFSVNRESARDVYSKRRIIAITEIQIVKWHNYKHLDWITVRRDDDKIYKFKEGDFKRLCIQGIEDMLLLLVQGKLTNLMRRSDKDRAAAMIHAIDKHLRTRRIMRSLEKFVGGRLYEGDFWLLQRTI